MKTFTLSNKYPVKFGEGEGGGGSYEREERRGNALASFSGAELENKDHLKTVLSVLKM